MNAAPSSGCDRPGPSHTLPSSAWSCHRRLRPPCPTAQCPQLPTLQTTTDPALLASRTLVSCSRATCMRSLLVPALGSGVALSSSLPAADIRADHYSWVVHATVVAVSRKARFKGFLVSQRTRKAKMIDRLSRIAVTAAFLLGAIAQAQAQTSAVCSGIDCQQGTCVPLGNTSYPSNILSPYQCMCNPGWQTLEGLLANLPHVLTLPCTIPNCTLNLDCGGTPAPPAQAPLTLEHVSSPCSLPGICGHGECVVTDLTKYPPMYKCSCQPGYENVGNITAGYCLKDCEVGSNCRALGISLPSNSAGSWEASVVSSFKVTVAVISASVSLPLFL